MPSLRGRSPKKAKKAKKGGAQRSRKRRCRCVGGTWKSRPSPSTTCGRIRAGTRSGSTGRRPCIRPDRCRWARAPLSRRVLAPRTAAQGSPCSLPSRGRRPSTAMEPRRPRTPPPEPPRPQAARWPTPRRSPSGPPADTPAGTPLARTKAPHELGGHTLSERATPTCQLTCRAGTCGCRRPSLWRSGWWRARASPPSRLAPGPRGCPRPSGAGSVPGSSTA
mmetsp:Transcript_38834/g.86781  ORF Transcript_38834/g.86781 Transcript_38834/m.86781 type:complete len:221 (-) Transcript_38834:433-1095(-)